MKTLLKGFFALLSIAFIGGMFVLGAIIYISFDLPQINSLADYKPAIPSRIYSKDGELLLEIYKEKREIAPMNEIPQKVINAFLAAEDDNFYKHSGVDYFGIMRATLKNIKAGRIVQGASTITQQVAKSLLLSNERTFTRKIKDLLLAKRIEDKFSKEDILFLYLNQVYLGGGFYGVKAAFKGYFGVELEEATIAQTALVAGLLVAPGKYSPYINPKYAKRRQRYVLKRLFKTQKISQQEYDSALSEDIKLVIRRPFEMKAPYFTDWIRQRLIENLGAEDFLTNGYKVTTSINWSLQKKAEGEVLKGVEAIDKRQGFKGAIYNLQARQEQLDFLRKERKKIYAQNCEYIIFNQNGTTEKQIVYEEGELERLVEKQEDSISQFEKKRFKIYLSAGNIVEEDKVLAYLKPNKRYKALVDKVSNTQKLIYVNIAGARAIIPYSGFRWAHKRDISESRNYWSWQKYPESIVSKGDVVYVKLKNLNLVNLYDLADNDFKKLYNKSEDIDVFRSSKFLQATLDQEPEAQGALISISPTSGEVISLVGGSNFRKSQFNRAIQSNRQPGSAFKPIIYASGLENGLTPASILLDSPQALGGVNESLSWKPGNYDGKFKGEMTLRRALETSRNIPTIRLTQKVGVQKIKNLVERIGIQSDLPDDLSISLGSFGVNLLDMVKMYAIFPNGGRKIRIKSVLDIEDRSGKKFYLDENRQDLSSTEEADLKSKVDISARRNLDKDSISNDKSTNAVEFEIDKEKTNPYLVNINEDQLYDPRLSYIMSNLLKGVVQNGTGKRAKSVSPFIGGKTGTTNNYVDAWFIGFSSNLVTGVWAGFDNNQTLGWGETGSKAALPIWKAFMEYGLKVFGEYDFKAPTGIVNVSIDPKTGRLADSSTKNPFMETFVEGSTPQYKEEVESEDSDVEDSGINFVDEDYYIAQ